MQCTNDLSLCLGLSAFEFLKTQEKLLLLKKLDSVKDLALLSLKGLEALVQRNIRVESWNPENVEQRVQRQMQIMKSYAISSCIYTNEEYPPLLRELYDPPFMLFWRGDLSCVYEKTAAIVGTRKPTGRGLQAAYETAYGLAAAGISVVSGLALGIDAAAHKGVLAAGIDAASAPKVGTSSCGKTAAVLACGVDSLYPAMNKRLGGTILENGGCVLSEYPPDTPPLKWRFPARNRIISALSAVTAVIEAPPGSGALITADFALEQGRELVFHETALDYPAHVDVTSKKRSVQQYVQDGARVIRGASDMTALVQNSHIEHKKQPEQPVFDFY